MELKEWMGHALQKAEESLRVGEVPVGCLFLYENEVIASGSNTVNETRNATRHAEINCIDKVLQYCKERDLDYHEVFKNIDVVVTVEPCIMCAAALHQLRIRSIVYGCPNDRFGGCASVFEVPKIADAKIDITSNVRAEEAMLLLKNFYKGTNPNAPECKVKKKKRDPNAQQSTPQDGQQNEQQNAQNEQEIANDGENKPSEELEEPDKEVILKNEENIKKSQDAQAQEKSKSEEKVCEEQAAEDQIHEKEDKVDTQTS